MKIFSKILSGVLFSAALMLGLFFIAPVANAQVAGCTTTGGYNPVTGMSCNGAVTILQGCSSTAGFSSANGVPCNGNTAAANGYNNVTVGSNGYLNGCASLSGYSSTTGYACNAAINGIIYAGPAGTVNIGLPGTVATAPVTTTPGLPTTGAGQNALPTMLLLIASAGLAAAGFQYSFRHSQQ
jgi:hypothetical protein